MTSSTGTDSPRGFVLSTLDLFNAASQVVHFRPKLVEPLPCLARSGKRLAVLGNERAATGRGNNHTLPLQLSNGGVNRQLGDVVLGSQGLKRREAISRTEFPSGDPATEIDDDLLMQRTRVLSVQSHANTVPKHAARHTRALTWKSLRGTLRRIAAITRRERK